MATQRGGMALLFEGHRYNKVRDGREGTVYWRCARLVDVIPFSFAKISVKYTPIYEVQFRSRDAQ